MAGTGKRKKDAAQSDAVQQKAPRLQLAQNAVPAARHAVEGVGFFSSLFSHHPLQLPCLSQI